ncbi:unnamed protein product [Closterium sp. Naga37s-1]|nr:unnamed protein product [Closterium sp. Naga37s-1]
MPHANQSSAILSGTLYSESLAASLLRGTTPEQSSSRLAHSGISDRLIVVLRVLVVTAHLLSFVAVANAAVPTCASLAAQAPSLNLLRNAGFEEISDAADWPSPLSSWVPLVPGAAQQQGQVAGEVQGEGQGAGEVQGEGQGAGAGGVGGETPPGDPSVAAEGGRFVRLQPTDGSGGIWGTGASEREGAVWPVQGLGQLLCVMEGGEQPQQQQQLQQGEFSLYFYARARECMMDVSIAAGVRPMRAMIVAVSLPPQPQATATTGNTGNTGSSSSVNEAELGSALAAAMSSGEIMVLHQWTVGVPCRNNSFSLSGLLPWRQHGPFSFHLPPSSASAAALSFPPQGVALHLVLLEGKEADSSSTPSSGSVELPVPIDVPVPLPPTLPGSASVSGGASVPWGATVASTAAATRASSMVV